MTNSNPSNKPYKPNIYQRRRDQDYHQHQHQVIEILVEEILGQDHQKEMMTGLLSASNLDIIQKSFQNKKKRGKTPSTNEASKQYSEHYLEQEDLIHCTHYLIRRFTIPCYPEDMRT